MSDATSNAGAIDLFVGGPLAVSGVGAQAAMLRSTSRDGTAGNVAVTLGADLLVLSEGAKGLVASTSGAVSAGSVVLAAAGDMRIDGVNSVGVDLSSVSSAGSAGAVGASITGEVVSVGDASTGVKLVSDATSNAGAIDLFVGGSLAVSGVGAQAAMLRSTGGQSSGDIQATLADSVLLTGKDSRGIGLTSLSERTAGNVSLQASTLSSDGDGSLLVLAQSIGSSQAGDVTIELKGDLTVLGESSTGVSARSVSAARVVGAATRQSIGLPLAVRGATAQAAPPPSSSMDGIAGSVALTLDADLLMIGEGSNGVVAESIGDSRSGDVTIALKGDIRIVGANSTAVTARSVSPGSVGNIIVRNQAGQELYVGTGGTAVLIEGGLDNIVDLRGLTITADGLSGNIVASSTGNDRVENFGISYGEFDLGAGVNQFLNQPGASLVPGPALSVGGTDSWLVNRGALIPGGAVAMDADLLGNSSSIQSSQLTGSFEQAASGETFAELDFATGDIDQVLATGKAKLDGKVYVDLLNAEQVPAGDFSQVLFGGELGVEDAGLILITHDSLVIDYQLDYSNDTAAKLNYAVDFSIAGLDGNQTSVGDYINAIQNGGSSPELADTVVTLLYQTNEEVYGDDLVALSPEFYAQQQAQLVRSSQVFGERLTGCQQDGGAFNADEKGRCAWVEADRKKSDYSDNSNFQNAEFDTSRFAMGVEQTFSDTLTFGFAASYEDVDGNGNNKNWNSNGDTTQAGVSARYRANEASITGVLSYGWGSANTSRSVSVTDVTVSSANRDMSVWGGILRLGYDYDFESAYLRPAIDLGFSRIDADSVQETGSGPLDLHVDDNSQTHGWVQPSVRGGMDIKFSGGQVLRYYGSLGVQYYFQDEDARVVASLAGAPAGVAPLEMNVDIGETTVNTMAGVDLVFENELTLEFQLIYRQADELDIRGGHLRLSMPL